MLQLRNANKAGCHGDKDTTGVRRIVPVGAAECRAGVLHWLAKLPMRNRSRPHPEDLVPVPAGCVHVTLKLKMTEPQRRALGRRLELDGGRYAGARACQTALEGVLGAYLKELEKEAFAADLLEAVQRLEAGA